jgi:hypothetical protein
MVSDFALFGKLIRPRKSLYAVFVHPDGRLPLASFRFTPLRLAVVSIVKLKVDLHLQIRLCQAPILKSLKLRLFKAFLVLVLTPDEWVRYLPIFASLVFLIGYQFHEILNVIEFFQINKYFN